MSTQLPVCSWQEEQGSEPSSFIVEWMWLPFFLVGVCGLQAYRLGGLQDLMASPAGLHAASWSGASSVLSTRWKGPSTGVPALLQFFLC